MTIKIDQLDAKNILEFLEDGFLRADTKGKIVMANQKIAKLCAYSSPSEMLGIEMKNLYADSNAREAMLKRLAKKEKLFNIEIQLKTKCGKIFPSLCNIKRIYDEHGTFIGTEGLVRDNTERLKAIKEIEQLAKFPAENPNPVLRISSEGKLLYHNKASQAILKKWDYSKTKTLPEEIKDFALNTLEIKKISQKEIDVKDKTFLLSFTPLIDKQFVNVYGLDISHRIAIEQQIRAANQQLKANEQQLRAANQQLAANEQQLRATNQQLAANEQQLRAANQQLQTINLQLIDQDKKLKLNKKRFERAQEIGHLGNWEYNLQTTHFWGSKEAKAIYGFSKDALDFTTDEVEKCIPDRQRVHQALIDLIESNIPYDLEFEIITKDHKKHKIIHSIAELENDKNGKPLKVSGLVHDITERKKAQEEIEQLAKFPEENPYPVLRISYEGHLVYYNKASIALLEHLNYFEKNALPEFWVEFVENTFKKDKIQTKEVTLGNQTFSLAFTPIQNKRFINVYGIEISKRIEAENKMKAALLQAQENENDLIRAQELAHVGNWHLDIKSNKVTWTKELFKMYGFDPTLPVPPYTEHMKLFTPESWKLLSSSLEKTRDTGIPYELELQTIRKDGSNGWMWVRGEAIKNNAGEITELWGAAQDITDRKNILLELQETKEKAEEADKLKSAFLANMSHEIRTPMNGILGFTNLLQKPNVSSEEQAQYLEIIQKSGERMLNTVNDLINISKIETGLEEIHLQNINPYKEIESIFEFFNPAANEKNISFTLRDLHIPSEVLMRTDLTKFNSIVTNLIKNAIKFTKDGEVSIGGAIKNDQILLWVRDTGIGIPKDRQKIVFDRFIQADINDKLAFQGSGLGLAIIKAYVEMLEGKIYLESEEGIGSCFYVSLPMNNKSPYQSEVKINNTSMHAERHINPSLCLLIAEDDDISYEHLAIILEPYTKKILRAKDGEEVIALAKTHKDIHLILMDINMPKLSGLSATSKIREFNKDMIIIAQTAYALEGDKEKALKAGCNGYISKPIQVELLLEMISNVAFDSN